MTPQPSWSPDTNLDLTFNSTNIKSYNTGWFGEGITGPVNVHESVRYDSANVWNDEGGARLNLALTDTIGNSGAIVTTDGKFSFLYGDFEVSAFLLASENGQVANWPAIWLNGQSWPTDGEIDVMEGLGGQAAYHYHSPAGGPGANVPGKWTGWHNFGCHWEPGIVRYYYDGHFVGDITLDIRDAPMYIVIDNSYTGGAPRSLRYPSVMRIRSVKVWSLL